MNEKKQKRDDDSLQQTISMRTPLNGFSKILKGKFKLRLDNLKIPIKVIQIKVWLKKNPCITGQSQSKNLEDKLKIGNFAEPEEQRTKLFMNDQVHFSYKTSKVVQLVPRAWPTKRRS